MARRKKEEEVVIEENVVTEEIENPAEKPELKAEVKEVKKSSKKKSSVKITAPRVNIRKSPSLVGEVKKIAVAGEKFDLVNDGDDGFYEISCENGIAYVMKDFAELV